MDLSELQKQAVVDAVMHQGQQLFTAEEQQLLEETVEQRISHAKTYPPEVYMLERNSVGFFAKGDIHGIKASIRLVIRDFHPDIVFIDGIVDLVKNFNEVEDSQQFLLDMMRLSTLEDCAIVGVLHTNKALDDHNMRGHLGTLLSQKCGTVLECSKEGDYFKVHCSDSRHEAMADWTFTFRDGQLADAESSLQAAIDARIQEQQAAREAKENERFEAIKSMIGDGIERRQLVMKIGTKFGVTQHTVNRWLKCLADALKIRVKSSRDIGTFVYINKECTDVPVETSCELPF